MKEFLVNYTPLISIIGNLILMILVISCQSKIKELNNKMHFTFQKMDTMDANLMSLDLQSGLMNKSDYIKLVLWRIRDDAREIAFHLFLRNGIKPTELKETILMLGVDKTISYEYDTYLEQHT